MTDAERRALRGIAQTISYKVRLSIIITCFIIYYVRTNFILLIIRCHTQCGLCAGCWAETAEPIEMPFGRLTHVEPRITFGRYPSTEMDIFGSCSGQWKAWRVSAAVYAAKWVIQSSVGHDMRCGLSSKFFDHLFISTTFLRPRQCTKYCDQRVCMCVYLSVCLVVCPLAYFKTTSPTFTKWRQRGAICSLRLHLV